MYLIQRDNAPFTAQDIREALGLKSQAMDGVILAGIASVIAMSARTVVRETWAIADGGDMDRYGTPVTMGPLEELAGTDRRLFRLCTYEPTPEAVAAARERVLRWCRKQYDIARQLLLEREAASRPQRTIHGYSAADLDAAADAAECFGDDHLETFASELRKAVGEPAPYVTPAQLADGPGWERDDPRDPDVAGEEELDRAERRAVDRAYDFEGRY